MAIPKTLRNNKHLNDLFIMQLRLKNYLILPSTQGLQLIIFMQFHLVSFAHNIYIQAQSQILIQFLINPHRHSPALHWVLITGSTYLIWRNVFIQRPLSGKLSLAKVEFFLIYLFMIFLILLDRFKYLSTKLKPFCKRHPG